MATDNRRFVRLSLVATTALSCCLIVVSVSRNRPFFNQSGAARWVEQALAILLAYAVLQLWFTRRSAQVPSQVFTHGTVMGAAGGVLQIFHLCIEHFFDLRGSWNGLTVLGFMFATFALWGVVGYRTRRTGETIAQSVGLAVWSATVTMTIAICAGVALELYLAPIPPESMRAWPEFQRSGWTDIHAFAIANTLDSVISHLVIAPCVGAVVGAIGSLLAKPRHA